MKKLEL